MSRLLFLDTETTGLHPDRRVWEVAWLGYRTEDWDTRQFDGVMQVSDVDLTGASLKGLEVGRFHERFGVVDDPAQFVPEAEVATVLHTITADVTLVGANPAFDAEGLAAMLHRHGLQPAWHHRLLDVSAMAVMQFGLIDHGRPPGLQTIATRLGIDSPTDAVDTAWGDAHLTRLVFEKLMARPASRQPGALR